MQLINTTETVFRHLTAEDGTVIAENAVIRRVVSETIIGLDGVLLGEKLNTMAIGSVEYGKAFLMTYKEKCYCVYQLEQIPVDAYFEPIIHPDQPTGVYFHVSRKTTAPRASYMAYNKRYDFFLCIPENTGNWSYLFVRDKHSKTIHDIGLPNTWGDSGRACLGEKLDQVINSKTNLAYKEVYAAWRKGRYNDHLKPQNTTTMMWFWKFDVNGIWCPDPTTIGAPITNDWRAPLALMPDLVA